MGVENSQEKDWQRLKEQYLKQIEDVLVDSGQPNVDGIINDVRGHLDRRYTELSPGERTWENFQKIVTEMGPPSEYAELVSEKQEHTAKKVSAKYVVILAVILTALTGAMFLLPVLLPKCTVPAWTNEIKRAFVNDPNLLGKWQSVDFVADINDFEPGEKHWPSDLYLKQMAFFENGRTGGPWSWTKGEIFHPGDRTIAHYDIREVAGATYLFFEWMSGDVTIRKMKPNYYVLKKVAATVPQQTQNEQATTAAIEAAKSWLKLVDDGAYDQSWTESAEYFKNNVSEDKWERAIEPVRKPLGKVLSREVKNSTYTTEVPGAPDGKYVIIQFETSFENKRSAVETVTPMLEPDGQWHVSGYYIK